MNENLQIEKTIVFRLFVLILKIKMLMKTIIARFHIFFAKQNYMLSIKTNFHYHIIFLFTSMSY